MSDFTIPFRSLVADPELSDAFNIWKKDVFLNLNCHAIGTIQSFQVKNGKAVVSATINYQKTYFQKDETTGQFVPILEDYPILLDCPAVVLCGAAAQLTMPIAQGDQCLILFNDRDINNWFEGANSGPVATPRLHSLSDGIALVGLNSVSNYDTERAVLKNDTAYVAVGTEKIEIANALTSLKTLLDDLISTIKGITVSPGTFSNSGGPVVGAGTISPASQLALDGIASDIGDLLE